MNRFLKKICFFILPVLMVGILVEILTRNIPNDYLYKREYLDKHAADIEILFLGSSHAYRDVNPVYINANSFNASYVSQSLYYDYRILERYSENWSHLKYIAIPVSYFSLFYSLEDSPESWRVKNYSIYYSMWTTYRIEDYSELLSNRLDINLGRISDYYLIGQSPITTSELGWGRKDASDINSDLTEKARTAAQRHTVEDDLYFDMNVEVLHSFISFADEHNVQIVFYTPPAFETYVENLNEEQLMKTIFTMQALDDRYSNVRYINFLTSDLFERGDYFDADHLNENGAKKLTLELAKLVDN
ncbi:MAG: hypothetical protein IPG44_17050 [Anaerolineales bacterium]|nr:hypothetical protein [Anaerolineales bacterium]